MSIKRTNKTIIHIYCEGESEKNYFEALKSNNIISKKYVLKPNSKTNDLERAIKKSKVLEGIDVIVIYVYDSDTFKNQKKITDNIEEKREYIYFNEENFEDFLACHTTRKVYRNKKPNLSRQLIEEIRELKISTLKQYIKMPKTFEKFKSIYDLLIELFEEKI